MTTFDGGQIIGGTVNSLSITVNPGISINPSISAIPEASPCRTLGHRFAWLTHGGAECARCGARR